MVRTQQHATPCRTYKLSAGRQSSWGTDCHSLGSHGEDGGGRLPRQYPTAYGSGGQVCAGVYMCVTIKFRFALRLTCGRACITIVAKTTAQFRNTLCSVVGAWACLHNTHGNDKAERLWQLWAGGCISFCMVMRVSQGSLSEGVGTKV